MIHDVIAELHWTLRRAFIVYAVIATPVLTYLGTVWYLAIFVAPVTFGLITIAFWIIEGCIVSVARLLDTD